MNRLTDNRLGNGWYQPKDKEERKELQNLGDVSYKELYERLKEYENLGLSPEEIRDFIENTRKEIDSLMTYHTFYAKLKEKRLINVEQDVERVISALEKQMPRAAEHEDGAWSICPNCGGSICNDTEYATNKEVSYCEHCGQALDWSDTE